MWVNTDQSYNNYQHNTLNINIEDSHSVSGNNKSQKMDSENNILDIKPYIKLNNVAYSYEDKPPVLKNITLEFYRGQFVIITGQNGSGKTTLIKLAGGIFKPEWGQVLIKGIDSNELSLGQIGNYTGYLFQQPERQLFTGSVREEIGFALDFKDSPEDIVRGRVDEMLKLFELEELACVSPFKLSRGEKQRLALAAILVNNPDLLLLDEPTTGLDPQRREKLSSILKQLRNAGKGIIVVSHDRKFIQENADRIIRLEGGGVVEDSTGSPQ